MTRSLRYHLGWIAATLLMLSLASLVPLWLWTRERAIAREKSERAAVQALQTLADLQRTQLRFNGTYYRGDVAGLLAISMPSPSVPMPPGWDQINGADVRGSARPTTYGYLFEALPAKGFLFRAYPANDAGLREFVVDEKGEVTAK